MPAFLTEKTFINTSLNQLFTKGSVKEFAMFGNMEPNKFEKLYSGFSNEKLVAIVANAADYQPLAVEAANAELAKRNVSNKEIENINHNITIQKKPGFYQSKVKPYFEKYFLFPGESPAIAYIINAMSAVLFLLYFLENIGNFKMIGYYISTNQLEPFIIYTAALAVAKFVLIFVFWRRIIVGWMYVCGLAIYGFVYTCLHWYYVIVEPAATEIKTLFFPDRDGEYFIFWWVFYGFAFYLVSKNFIRKRYNITTLVFIISAIIGSALAIQYAL